MSVSKLLYSFIFLSLLIACKNKNNSHSKKLPITIDLENNNNIFKEKKLSEIANSIEYIKLQNIPQAFINRPNSIHVCDSFIFISQLKSVLKFNRKGNFICKIGKQGRGPKEYAQCYGTRVDREKKLIYINAGSSKKILVYDFNGTFIRNLKFHSNMDFAIIDSIHIASPINNYTGKAKYKLLVNNSKCDTVNSLQNTVQFTIPKTKHFSFANFTRKFYRLNNELHFIPQYGDTVFQIQFPTSIHAKYVIQKGKYKLPANCRMEAIGNYKRYVNKSAKYLFTIPMETQKYVFICYHSANGKGNKKLALYNKHTKELYSIGNPKTNSYGFINDLDGIGNYIHRLIQDDQYMITSSSAIKFLEKHDKLIEQIKNNTAPKNINPTFREFLKSVKEDDNYIIQITHLKDNI
jgi:hypothetical protein